MIGYPTCQECGREIKVFFSGTGVTKKATPDHDLCQKCWKAEQDRSRTKTEAA